MIIASKETGTIYIRHTGRSVAETVDIGGLVSADIDTDGNLVGIEIIGVEPNEDGIRRLGGVMVEGVVRLCR